MYICNIYIFGCLNADEERICHVLSLPLQSFFQGFNPDYKYFFFPEPPLMIALVIMMNALMFFLYISRCKNFVHYQSEVI